ncbi:DUF2491 family protein [uncultured Devosia sp.]|uniref:DUF2491 family protein n=1 Tax=uncultured Devosia sp. TaxID=211434 RepID=UPI0035CC591B
MINWFGKKLESVKRTPLERGPLGVALGGAIELDFLSLEADAIGGQPSMPLPQSGPLIVSAYGEVRLDAASTLSRYYDDQHHMLQVLSASGSPGDQVQDVSYYQPWDSVVPAGPGEWDRWRGRNGLLGQPRYDADGIMFERFWGEGPDRAEPVQFVEQVEDGESRRTIQQTCMLYFRPLGNGREMLLINIEQDADNHRAGGSVEFLLGYGLGPADVRRV